MKYKKKKGLKLFLVSSYIPESEIDQECFLVLKKIRQFFGIEFLDIKATKRNYVNDTFETLEELQKKHPWVRLIKSKKYAKNLSLESAEKNHNFLNLIKDNTRTAKSLIYGIPSFEMKPIPRHIKTAPEPVFVWGSGSISKPNYKDTEGGIYGREHHHRGALLIEVHPNGDHRVHQLWYDKKTKSICLFKWKFTKEKVSFHTPQYLIEGDIHPNLCCLDTVAETHRAVRALKIPNLVRHDYFDATTISHHIENNIEAKSEIFEELGTLRDEIELCSNFFKNAEKEMPRTKFHYIYSNHPEHLIRYLKEKHRQDYVNHRTVVELNSLYHKNKKTFWWNVFNLHNNLNKKRHKFYNEGDVLVFKGKNLHFHGHLGIEGGFGTAKSLASLGENITGHIHKNSILRNGSATAGTSTSLILPYTNENGGSAWSNGHVFLNENGQLNSYVIKNGVGSLLF